MALYNNSIIVDNTLIKFKNVQNNRFTLEITISDLNTFESCSRSVVHRGPEEREN